MNKTAEEAIGEYNLQKRLAANEKRFGPRKLTPEEEAEQAIKVAAIIVRAAELIQQQETKMHYRNGREAKNGDKIVKLQGGKITAFGVLHDAVAGNDYCNGEIAIVQQTNTCACMCDCLHVDDVAEFLKEKGLDKRPEGK